MGTPSEHPPPLGIRRARAWVLMELGVLMFYGYKEISPRRVRAEYYEILLYTV